ncbi:pilus assembly protein TadG-related protein [Variovorax sp. NFACC27]|uniref:pilus assembly protein TadG-related protein n=1 Tax=unclassified Variovorax TaxID=663243 RepID=UPI0008952DBD|nr:Putative Flp pilus-assembly TadE/G-like [Variovorax sp. NFACC28]SEG96488.1 Putative Flp pilus-assembly TadE/G-like [Variovorax sp. NFACC29]SFD98268.1 Putative Flp pilus-assembly TadE/G-like [Variovorax sp. NFACC26]SFH26633.1 Putative Flp pilus-assembly TadE/G-like [Variovorax sp. NFACC27]
MHVRCFYRRQRGAMIVTVALFLLFLIGFMGIALDFGHLFVVRTELQTAVDSCALSAARELDGQSTALTRAVSAGQTAGNANNVNMQSSTWSGQGKIVAADITFRDAFYAVTTSPALARYAQCTHAQANINIWLMKAMGASSGDTAGNPATRSVAASAVATRASAQTTCPIPVAAKPKAGSTAPNYGFVTGEWVMLIMAQNAATGGQIGWANLDGSNNASETESELNGRCGTKVGDTLGTPGVQTTVADVWNQRFGIYKNSGDPSMGRPDYTGYAYTSLNWPAQFNAYNGAPGAGAPASAQNFVTKRAAFASCADTGTKVNGANSCESITGLSLNSFQKLANPGNVAGGHMQYGLDRRFVTVPVIDGGNHVIDYLCMLMLQPLSIPMTDVQLEFLGNAGATGSPCTTSGLAGGAAGPLVPVLVR